MKTFFNELDQALLLMLNKCHHPIIDYFFRLVTSVSFWVPLYVFLLAFIKKKLGWPGVCFFIATITISDQSSASLFKPFFERYRPCYQVNIPLIHLVGEHEGIYGFPSSHASNTFSFAMLFWKVFRLKHKHTRLFFVWAAIVSYGRIYGGMHYPLDVICGAMLGICVGALNYRLYRSSKWWRYDI
ncbi:phosphatase PAP2 family protein [Cardinium endosymbiont of Tipula unca]|uniref:phosphatase PAP2 family protein n=1 Tax=Cardinium endosymbiont of Tipula unca TaxID=3066216 RepID=UPI0030D32FFF